MWHRRVQVTAGLLAGALALTACASGGGKTGAHGTPAHATPAGSVSVQPTGSAVNPVTPVVVKASDATLTGVSVANATTGRQVTGSLSPDRTTWTSSEPLGYGSTYQVTVDATGRDGHPLHQVSKLHTLQPKAQAYPAMIPAPNDHLTFGVGQIIGVSFDQDVTDKAAAEKALTVTSNPPQPGSWYWIDNRTAHYRPKDYWQPGTTITLRAGIYGVDLGDGVYGQTDRVATYHIHDSWIAKADGKTEQVRIFHNGRLVKTMPTSLGSPGHPTHEGPHVISDKQPSVIMDSCTYGVCAGQPGYYRETVYLDERISTDGEFVHSAPWSVGDQGSSNVSHGCVNLAPANAQWFYDHFGLGDVVEITHSGGPPLPVWDTYGDWELTWRQWRAGSALH